MAIRFVPDQGALNTPNLINDRSLRWTVETKAIRAARVERGDDYCPATEPGVGIPAPSKDFLTITVRLPQSWALQCGPGRLWGRVGFIATAGAWRTTCSQQLRVGSVTQQHRPTAALAIWYRRSFGYQRWVQDRVVPFQRLRDEPGRAPALRLGLRMTSHAGAPLDGQRPVNGTTRVLRNRVELTPLEQQIFALLLEANTRYRLGSTLRVAGGWVRDKLLGLSPDDADLDIALDNMLGRMFAEHVHELLTERGEHHGSVHVIRLNPAQSKHLETARMRIFGAWVDFVNLRKETYAANSRIPTMEIGTAEEDAYRRDLTINALFYNINTEQVEDWTRMGLSDLSNGWIRTPLPPLTTFLDDPLRVLRAVRFASRFGFAIVPELLEAASTSQVREALAQKVSRERIAQELLQMMAGPRPSLSLALLHEMGLGSVLFPLPEAFADTAYPERWATRSVAAVSRLERFGRYWLEQGIDPWADESSRRIAVLSACLSPLFPIEFVMKGEDSHSVVAYILRDGLRVNQQEKKMILACLSAGSAISDLVTRQLACDERSCRIRIGQLIRSLGPGWELALLLQLALDERFQEPGPIPVQVEKDGAPLTLEEIAIARAYLAFRERVKTEGLDRAWELRPLLDGHEIHRLLPALPRGPLIGQVMERQIEEQLADPTLTNIACAERLRQLYAVYTRPAEDR